MLGQEYLPDIHVKYIFGEKIDILIYTYQIHYSVNNIKIYAGSKGGQTSKTCRLEGPISPRAKSPNEFKHEY